MIKLLRSNFTRLIKSATFWIFFSLYVLYAILTPVICHSTEYNATSMEQLSLGYGMIGLPILSAVVAFISTLILGSDFTSGTLRSKIAMGHSRNKIYVANLLTTSVISIALLAVYLILFCAISLPLFGKITAPKKNVFLLLLIGTLMILAYSSIFTFVTMTSKNQIAALIISLCLMIASYFIVLFVFDAALSIPPFIYEDAEIFGMHYYKKGRNPKLPSDATLGFCQFMLDFLPTGQCLQLTPGYECHWQSALYSLFWIVSSGGLGMLIFNKSDIK